MSSSSPHGQLLPVLVEVSGPPSEATPCSACSSNLAATDLIWVSPWPRWRGLEALCSRGHCALPSVTVPAIQRKCPSSSSSPPPSVLLSLAGVCEPVSDPVRPAVLGDRQLPGLLAFGELVPHLPWASDRGEGRRPWCRCSSGCQRHVAFPASVSPPLLTLP